MPNRSEIVARIHKLRQMTTDRGCTESEAQTAATKLASLLAEFNISETEESIRTAEYITLALMLSPTHTEWKICGKPIARLFRTKFFLKYDSLDILGIGKPKAVTWAKFFGARQDAEASIGMLELVYNSINFASKSRGCNNESFRAGMAHRFCERLNSMAPAQDQSFANALILVKDTTVHEEFAKWCAANDICITRTLPKSKVYDQARYVAGRDAASRIDLNSTKLTPTSQPKRLSHNS